MSIVDPYTTPRQFSGTFTIPAGARALLIDCDQGAATAQPVMAGQSVLNIQQDLLSHLSDYPHSDEFLMEIQSYVTARLEARKKARTKKGGFTIPMGREWVVTSMAAMGAPMGVSA